jgi:hypothetical protein
MNTKPSPTTQKVRFSISVDPKVNDVFERLSRASKVSKSRALSDWLADTLDAAEHLAELLEKLQTMPKTATRQINQYAAALEVTTESMLKEIKGFRVDLGGGGSPAVAPIRSKPKNLK